jgi:hypothetical protein
MQEISRDEFYDLDASHMVGVSADEREFYRLDEDTIGVLAIDREDDIRVRGTVLRSSPPDGRYRNDGSNFESSRTEDGLERSRKKVEEWLQGQ